MPTRTVPLSDLIESKTNPRKSFGDLSELTATVKRHGVVQPLVVRETKQGLEVVAGARRFRAAKKAGLKEVPVTVRELTDEQALEVQLVENLQREDLHPLEEAEAFHQLHLLGKSYDEVADEVGRARTSVYERVKLLELSPPARKAFTTGRLTAATALLVARLKGERLQEAAVQRLEPNRYGDPVPHGEARQVLKRLLDEETAKERRTGLKAFARRQVEKVVHRVRSFALGRVVDVVQTRADFRPEDLRLLVVAELADGAPELVLERRGFETPKALQARLAKMSGSELRGLYAELTLARWVDTPDDEANVRLKAACKAYGVDFRDVDKTVRANLEREEQTDAAEKLFRPAR
jgi:ParB/RepB/Spo0J family partition protein